MHTDQVYACLLLLQAIHLFQADQTAVADSLYADKDSLQQAKEADQAWFVVLLLSMVAAASLVFTKLVWLLI